MCFREEAGPCIEKMCDSDGWCWENPLPMPLRLNAIHGSGASSVWAVGKSGLALEHDGQDVILHHAPVQDAVGVWVGGPDDVWLVAADQAVHWDGSAWASHRPAAGVSLTAIWGAGARDVWAAGSGRAFHWDGTAWAEEPLPAVESVSALDGTAGDDIWLAGGDGEFGSGPGRLLHWDGAGWSLVYEQPGYAWEFRDVVAVSANDVWALAYLGLVHWNGTTWTSFSLPHSGTIMHSMSVVDGTVVVANDEGQQFAMQAGAWTRLPNSAHHHWPKVDPSWAIVDRGDGLERIESGQWTRIPEASATNLRIERAFAFSPSDIWAFPLDDDFPSLPVRWDGARWSPTQAPEPVIARAVTASGPNDLWVSGTAGDALDEVLLHYDGAWSYATAPGYSGIAPALWAARPGDLWFAGWESAGSAAKLWRGDGVHWTQVTALPAEPVFSIWSAGPDGEFWFGATDELLRLHQAEWQRFPVSGGRVVHVLGLDSDDIVALTASSALRWNGQEWAVDPALPAGSITAFCASTAGYWAASPKKIQHRGPLPQTWTTVPIPEPALSCAATDDGVVRVFSYFGRILSRQFP